MKDSFENNLVSSKRIPGLLESDRGRNSIIIYFKFF